LAITSCQCPFARFVSLDTGAEREALAKAKRELEEERRRYTEAWEKLGREREALLVRPAAH